MESAGFSTVFANDIDVRSMMTFNTNTPDIPFRTGDIAKVPSRVFPEFDCLTGGFPCQPFSVSGKRLGFDDTRGTVFFEIARILRDRRPQMFLLENVKGLTHHDDGRTLQTILDVLRDDLGYEVHHQVLNSKDYGVPQNRQRIFIVGFDHPTNFTFPEPEELDVTVHDLLEKEVDDKYYIREGHKHYEPIIAGVTSSTKVYQWRWSYIRENKSGVCPTLLASYMQPTLVKVEDGVRGITPREGLRLQGFPEEFEFPEEFTDKDKMHQIGNSVSVPVVQKVAERMYAERRK